MKKQNKGKIEMRANAYALTVIKNILKKRKETKPITNRQYKKLIQRISAALLASVMINLPEEKRQKFLNEVSKYTSDKIFEFDQLN